ncbi:alpha/beta fold hydrolase [Streptomyces luteogriseus]
MAHRRGAPRPGRGGAAPRRLLPGSSVVMLPGASHHSLPTEQPDELNRLLAEFLA